LLPLKGKAPFRAAYTLSRLFGGTAAGRGTTTDVLISIIVTMLTPTFRGVKANI
jgi:hypothetical protein